MGCGSCIGTIVFTLLGLAILGKAIKGGNTFGVIVLLLIALGAYVIWQFRGQPNVRQVEATPQDYEWLGKK